MAQCDLNSIMLVQRNMTRTMRAFEENVTHINSNRMTSFLKTTLNGFDQLAKHNSNHLRLIKSREKKKNNIFDTLIRVHCKITQAHKNHCLISM